MNTDIRIAVSFKGHRKRKRLKTILGAGSTDYLLDLWIGTAQNHPSGILKGMDETDIALEAGWDGDPSLFIKALSDCGFIDKKQGVFVLHDWEDHQGYVVHAESRKDRARAAAHKRWKNNSKSSCVEHADSMPDAMPLPAPAPAPAPAPVPVPKSKSFVKPTLEQVTDYCQERKNNVNPQKWYDHYESNGWKIGKALAPMKDWKAAVRTWEHNDYGGTGNGSQNASGGRRGPQSFADQQRAKHADAKQKAAELIRERDQGIGSA